MSGFTAIETIERPADEVFAFLVDYQRSVRWVKGLISVEPLTSGGIRAGAKWTEVRRIGDRETKSIVEIVEHQGINKGPPYIHARRSVTLGIQRIYHYRVEVESKKSCRVELTAEFHATNILLKPFSGFAANTRRRQDEDILTRLKDTIEARDAQKNGGNDTGSWLEQNEAAKQQLLAPAKSGDD